MMKKTVKLADIAQNKCKNIDSSIKRKELLKITNLKMLETIRYSNKLAEHHYIGLSTLIDVSLSSVYSKQFIENQQKFVTKPSSINNFRQSLREDVSQMKVKFNLINSRNLQLKYNQAQSNNSTNQEGNLDRDKQYLKYLHNEAMKFKIEKFLRIIKLFSIKHILLKQFDNIGNMQRMKSRRQTKLLRMIMYQWKKETVYSSQKFQMRELIRKKVCNRRRQKKCE